MTPRELHTALSRRGVELTVEAGELHYRAPKGALTPELRENIAALKAELLPLVAAQVRDTSGWLRAIAGHRRTIGAFEPCVLCSAGTWARYSDIPFCRNCAEARGAVALAYWDALSELARLHAEGPDADPDASRRAIDHAARLMDDLGAQLAVQLRQRWSGVTGRCPLCGGVAH